MKICGCLSSTRLAGRSRQHPEEFVSWDYRRGPMSKQWFPAPISDLCVRGADLYALLTRAM